MLTVCICLEAWEEEEDDPMTAHPVMLTGHNHTLIVPDLTQVKGIVIGT